MDELEDDDEEVRAEDEEFKVDVVLEVDGSSEDELVEDRELDVLSENEELVDDVMEVLDVVEVVVELDFDLVLW